MEVDNEGSVSLRGNSSVTVWINGKASGLTADNQADILEMMPAEDIKQVEVITNPSAKYSPEGTAGIINIILKDDRKPGYYGSVKAGADTDGGYQASGNINYSSSKVDAYANLSYRNREMKGGGITSRENTANNSFLDQQLQTTTQQLVRTYRGNLAHYQKRRPSIQHDRHDRRGRQQRIDPLHFDRQAKEYGLHQRPYNRRKLGHENV